MAGRKCLEEFLQAVRKWAMEDSRVEAAVLVGSYARGMERPASDLDLVIIAGHREDLLTAQAFVGRFGVVDRKRTENYGACTSVRVWYRDGWEVEFGIVEPSWLAVPLDEGTKRVLRDGYQVIADKKDRFKKELHLE